MQAKGGPGDEQNAAADTPTPAECRHRGQQDRRKGQAVHATQAAA